MNWPAGGSRLKTLPIPSFVTARLVVHNKILVFQLYLMNRN
jgi:hypothetical protein